MANEQQFRLSTKFVATRGVKDYRNSINEWITTSDSVLEIGCEWGTTTALIAPQCKDVLGTDISETVIERARQRHPDLRFAAFDAFDVLAASRLGDFSKIYIDMSGLSGYRSLLDVISLLNMYATVLRPEAIVIKSGALKHFAAHCVPWPGQSMADAITA
jgi:demethylmenaquinone methyltransferase / 2-methoxy-6-polyprenyl-1,4-benzoquinol methylase